MDLPPTDASNPTNDVLDVARTELLYRRDKQWHIFAWTTTILVAVVGGAITLAGKTCAVPRKPEVVYSTLQSVLMAVAIIVLSCYACVWINENMRLEELAREKVVKLLEAHNIGGVLPDPKKLPFGYVTVVVLLTIGAVIAIAAPLLPNACSAVSASLPRVD
jgi:hypothetical protein